MKVFVIIGIISFLNFTATVQPGPTKNLVCFYDSQSSVAEDPYKITDFELALQFCTHVVYGYANINPDTFRLVSGDEKLDITKGHFATVTGLKTKFPHIKFLLSVGGDHYYIQSTDVYVNLLEAGSIKQNSFIESARDLIKNYNFDGLDLAFNLPRNKPRKVHSGAGLFWKNIKKMFTGDFVVDEKAAEHQNEFTGLVKNLKTALRPHNLMLTLTVLPNVNSSWYYDAPAIINDLDFVNLAAFDFVTPERNPNEADFTAPLYELSDQNRLGHYNVDFQVQHWLQQSVPANKINIGITSYGQAWVMTSDSGSSGIPIVAATNGPAVLLRLGDPTKRVGTYDFVPASVENPEGMWITYETANKAAYVKAKNLGGVALFDLNNDDFSGLCGGKKHPIPQAIKSALL